MRHAWILSGGAAALILLAVVCIPRHLASPPRPIAMTPAAFHASFEQGSLVFRGSLPNERSRATILEQAHILLRKTRMRVIDQFIVDKRVATAAWVDTVPHILPALGLMVEHGAIMIDGRSLVVIGQVAGHREKADLLQILAPAIRAGLRIEDRVRVAPTTASASAAVPLAAVQLSLNRILEKSSIEFEPNSAVITTKGQAVLDEIIALLRKAPGASIEIAGPADHVGEAESDTQLSRHRAEAVKQYLTDHGLTNPLIAIGSHGKHGTSIPRNQRIELLM